MIEELQATGDIGGVPVYNFDPEEISSASAGAKKEWIFFGKPTASDAQIKSVCDEAEDCLYAGHPDEGGLGFSTISASFSEVESLARAHKQDLEFLEPVMPVQAFPLNEVNASN